MGDRGLGSPQIWQEVTAALIVDTNGDAWVCVSSGTPDTWQNLAGTDTAGSLHLLLTPYRVVDTRNGTALNSGTGALQPFPNLTGVSGVTKNFTAWGGSSGVPSNAVAVLGHLHIHPDTNNLKIVPGFGYLTTWKQATLTRPPVPPRELPRSISFEGPLPVPNLP